jgi:thiamine biosynthesis lipoprotein
MSKGVILTRFKVVVFAMLVCTACKAPPEGARAEWVLGTFCRIDLFEYGTAERYTKLFDRLFELDKLLSASRNDSELSLVNKNAGIQPVAVSPELMAVLLRALYFARASVRTETDSAADVTQAVRPDSAAGDVMSPRQDSLARAAFDPTIGPLVKLWGIGTDAQRIPSREEIDQVLPLVNWQDVILSDTDAEPAVLLLRSGMALDLGAIAKGYAADELVRLLREEDIPRALIDLGGNVYVYGSKADGGPWRVGVQNPLNGRGSYLGVLSVQNTSVVTSGVYERFFEAEGKRYHHILDTSSAYPVENDLLSVTIIAPVSMDADALSTSAFALGFEKGRELVLQNNAEAVFVFNDKSIRLTAGAAAYFELSDESFRIELN